MRFLPCRCRRWVRQIGLAWVRPPVSRVQKAAWLGGWVAWLRDRDVGFGRGVGFNAPFVFLSDGEVELAAAWSLGVRQSYGKVSVLVGGGGCDDLVVVVEVDCRSWFGAGSDYGDLFLPAVVGDLGSDLAQKGELKSERRTASEAANHLLRPDDGHDRNLNLPVLVRCQNDNWIIGKRGRRRRRQRWCVRVRAWLGIGVGLRVWARQEKCNRNGRRDDGRDNREVAVLVGGSGCDDGGVFRGFRWRKSGWPELAQEDGDKGHRLVDDGVVFAVAAKGG